MIPENNLRKIRNLQNTMIQFDAATCEDFSESTSREWLETNGIGGFASGTISGANTRRYHGLLIAATKPPVGRIAMLSKFEETLIIDGEKFELSANSFPGSIHPQGFKFIKSFRLDPFPIWTFEVNGIEIEKAILMVHGENTTVCQWTLLSSPSKRIALELRPLLSFRDYHHLQREDPKFDGAFLIDENEVSMQPYADLPRLYLGHNAFDIERSGDWYRNFEYSIEKERGFDFREDLFQPCVLKFELQEPAIAIASTSHQSLTDALSFRLTEIARREALLMQSEAKDDFTKQLVIAADQFIVSRGEGETIIAGYHWFSDWGRDTMIALNGLTLATNRPEITQQILLEFSRHISKGMLPNRFPDVGEEPDYNSVDATLWYFEAIRAYISKTGDLDFVRESLYEKLVEIIAWHLRGTRFGIRVDTDGLLSAGELGVQLTWMDAKIGDWVVTPRRGKPVEIQALWYNALCTMAHLAEEFGDSDGADQYAAMASTAQLSFNQLFWNADEDCLYDVIDGVERDDSIRPNQIFAVALHYSMLEQSRARKVVAKVEEELLTPFGLRSLSRSNSDYRRKYLGSPRMRDSSYHQGTVWTWLIGPFVDACINAGMRDEKTNAKILAMFEAIRKHLSEAGLGQISEIFDAELPHAPRGCIAQAWSIAEVLRVWRAYFENTRLSARVAKGDKH